jgi:hypothetical protein
MTSLVVLTNLKYERAPDGDSRDRAMLGFRVTATGNGGQSVSSQISLPAARASLIPEDLEAAIRAEAAEKFSDIWWHHVGQSVRSKLAQRGQAADIIQVDRNAGSVNVPLGDGKWYAFEIPAGSIYSVPPGQLAEDVITGYKRHLQQNPR